MKRYYFTWLFALISSLLTPSCKKDEGIGGDATIRGKVHVTHYNSTFTQYISEYDGADIYVYIIYGDHVSYGKRIKTNYEGKFEFEYLYPGDYKVYTYSKDSTLAAPSGKIPVVVNAHISGRKQTLDIGTMEIFE